MKPALGVDIGGTNIRAGIVTPDGILMGTPVSIPTNARENKDVIINRIQDTIRQALAINNYTLENLDGIGLGVTGPLDVKNGMILQCPTLPTMDYFPLKSVLAEKFSVPVYMNNDANAMMLGETFWGAGKGCGNVLGITLGTGLGCAIIFNRKIWMGATETAGEIWMSPYDNRIIEETVSGRGVSGIYAKLSGKNLGAREISELALSGDEAAIATWNEFGKAIAYALAWSVNLIDPQIVIIGGSIANAFDLFIKSLKEFLNQYLCPVPAAQLKIVKASLGDNAGFMGAAALVYAK